MRLSRDLWQLESQHIDLARAVSAVAQANGAVADRSAVQEVQLAIAAKPDAIDVNFWRTVLGYTAMADDNAVDPLGHGSTVWMQELDEAKPLRHAMHIDVSVAREHVEARLEAALAAGGRWSTIGGAGDWTLADQAGNRVCICRVARWVQSRIEGLTGPAIPARGQSTCTRALHATGAHRMTARDIKGGDRLSKVRVHISGRGRVRRRRSELENPLGEGGERLHDWLIALQAWRPRRHRGW